MGVEEKFGVRGEQGKGRKEGRGVEQHAKHIRTYY